MSLRLAIAQVNATVGDIDANVARARRAIARGRDDGADVVVLPELVVTGYPPEDLLLKMDFVDAAADAVRALAAESDGTTVVIGTVREHGDLYNAAAVLHGGAVAGWHHKQRLPNYGVFDENRYFAAGADQSLFLRRGVPFGVSICEDIWYPDGPAAAQAASGARLLVNISASPFHAGKGASRLRMLSTRAEDAGAYVVYCNLVGGQDELVFDGQSLVIGPDGTLVARGRQFEEDYLLVDLDLRGLSRHVLLDPRRGRTAPPERPLARLDLDAATASPHGARVVPQAVPATIAPELEPLAEVYQALVTATRDYVCKCGFGSALIGLSGGIDSALTAVIAADALGPAAVTGIAMPTRYSSAHSIEDAEQLAQALGIGFDVVPIDGIFQAFLDALTPVAGGPLKGLTEENLQPRVRGTLLMGLSNHSGALVLTTGNKSEIGVGYSTLYGDTAGGYAVLKDVPKTLVYDLARWRNARDASPVIPVRTIEKAPSAELRPDQKDSDSLPEYDALDPILRGYVEENCSPAELVARGHAADAVRRVITLVDRNEYKRRQSPPGVKITPRAFGKDWRLPIAHRYRPTSPR